jgi:ribosomal protein L32E
MRYEKQRIAMQAIACGRYSYKDGWVHTRRSGKIRPMKGGTLPGGYTQIIVSNHKRGSDRVKATVYIHIFIYMMHYGEYPEGMEIDHINQDKSDHRIENLRCVTSKENSENRNKWIGERTGKMKRIRYKEIAAIRDLHAKGMSQSFIARELNLNRLSVRYTIKRIEAGDVLKHEKPRYIF